MDRRKLFFGLAIVFGGFGLLALTFPSMFWGNGTFHERNYGLLQAISVGSLIIGGVFTTMGVAVRRS